MGIISSAALTCIMVLMMIWNISANVYAQNSSNLDDELVAEIERVNKEIGDAGHPQMHQTDWIKAIARRFIVTRLWPVDASVSSAIDSTGKKWNMTGKGAAAWFFYGGAGSWKEYDTVPMQWLILCAWGDRHPDRPGNVLGDIRYTIKEKDGRNWSDKKVIEGPTNSCRTYLVAYKPHTDRIHIEAQGGFYIHVYKVAGARLPGSFDAEQEPGR